MKTNFRHYLAFFSLVALFGLYACTGSSEKKAEGDANTKADSATVSQNEELVDPRGEKENAPNTIGEIKENDDSFIKFTANGQTFECKYVGKMMVKPNNFDRIDKNRTMLIFERGSSEQMTEKILINIVNHDLEKIKFPYVIEPQAVEGKLVSVMYSAKKAGVYIDYHCQNAVSITLEKYDGEYVEGTFSCRVENAGYKSIKIENGQFRIKVAKQQVPA